MTFCNNCGKELNEGAVFCPECGLKVLNKSYENNDANIDSEMKLCPQCREKMPADMFYCLSCGHQFIHDAEEELEDIVRRVQMTDGVWKNKWISLTLCIFLGGFGAHKFYEGKTLFGVIYLFTLGLFGVGWLVDVIRIALKPSPYKVK